MCSNQIINHVKIRPEELPDYSEITKVNNLAFKQENEANLVNKIRHSDRYIYKLSLVAKLNNQIVGYIMFSYIDLIGQETVKVLALAPIAVLPKYQNQGIGSLLVRTSLNKAEKIPAPIVIVLGNPKFYARFGFEPAINSNIQSPFDISDEYFMVKFLSSYQQKKYQGKVSYPDIFHEV